MAPGAPVAGGGERIPPVGHGLSAAPRFCLASPGQLVVSPRGGKLLPSPAPSAGERGQFWGDTSCLHDS